MTDLGMSASWDQNYHSRKPPKASPRSKVDDTGGGGAFCGFAFISSFSSKMFCFLSKFRTFLSKFFLIGISTA